MDDVSRTQLLDGNNGDWEKYDLKVGNDKIDVKNARRKDVKNARRKDVKNARRKDLNMTRHFVQSKFERTEFKDIKICGIVSPWDMEGQSRQIEYIGETSIEKINELKEALKKAFKNTKVNVDGLLDLKESYGNAFYPESNYSRVFPPWIFDYPDYVYCERDKALGDFREMVEKDDKVVKEMLKAKQVPGLLPVMVAAGIPVTGDEEQNEKQKVIFTFADKLVNRDKDYRLSLPIIYLTVLCHFLNMVRNPEPARVMPEDLYNECLFGRDYTKKDRPLGIYDPLSVISGLINVLEKLWKHGKNHILDFNKFELVSFNTLKGVKTHTEKKLLWLIAEGVVTIRWLLEKKKSVRVAGN